jgi:hypothetical protein
MIAVRGYCPMGCGETLMLGAGGYVTCGHLDCPQPSAVSDILDVRETEHLVDLGPLSTFKILHPLRERLGRKLLDCDLHAYLESLAGPPVARGTYRAVWSGDRQRWIWSEVQS